MINGSTVQESTTFNDTEQADPPSDVKPLKLSDEEWSNEKTIDELQLNLASVEQMVINQSGQVIKIRKYLSLCRRLGRFIPIADPTPEYVINISDLKSDVRTALEKIHPELRRLVFHQAVLRLFEAAGIEPYTSIGRKLKVKFIGRLNYDIWQ